MLAADVILLLLLVLVLVLDCFVVYVWCISLYWS